MFVFQDGRRISYFVRLLATVLLMSVVNSCLPCYRGAAVHALAPHFEYRVLSKIPGIWDYTLSPDPDLFPGTKQGNREALIEAKEDVSADAKWGSYSSKYCTCLLNSVPRWEIDTEACYRFFYELFKNELPALPAPVDPTICETVVDFVKDSGLINGKDFLAAAQRTSVAERTGNKYDKMLHCVSRIKDMLQMHSVKRINRELQQGRVRTLDKPRTEVHELAVPRGTKFRLAKLPLDREFPQLTFSVHYFGGILAVITKAGAGYLMTPKDLDRIMYYISARCSVVRLDTYMKLTHNNHIVAEALNYLDSLLVKRGVKDRVPEAFVSASNISLNCLAGFLSKDGMSEMIADHISEGLETVVPHREFLTKIAPYNDTDHRTFRSIVRIAMPISYDVPGIFSIEKKLHATKNPVGDQISDLAEKTYLEFKSYNRLNFLRQFKKQYGRYPGWVDDAKTDEELAYNRCVKDGTGMKLSLVLADAVNLKGCLAYQSRSGNIGAHLKDTAMMPHTLTPSESPVTETNQIAYMAAATSVLDLDEWRSSLGQVGYRHYHKVGYKNETAKENGRLFFISELKDKLLLGELEDNIGVFLKGCPGNAVGAPPGDVANSIFSAMCKEPAVGEAKLLISDDISKWSPHMPVRVQQDSADFWAEVFDQPWISNTPYINGSDYVVLDTAGWRAHYASNGSNKEGQTGKQMSYLMTNLKAFAVAKCRGKYGGEKLFNGAVNLLTFLDDGFTAADLAVENYKITAKKVLETLCTVQRHCGFVMKVKKSFPSDRFCQFLSREYYCGARLYDPVKSVAKRALRMDEQVASLPEDIREVTAWASGATESGTPREYVYSTYIIDCARAVARKTGRAIQADGNYASFLLAPTAVGGCGVMPPHGVLASLVKDLYTEQLQILKDACDRWPAVQSKYARAVVADISAKSGRGLLRAHKTVTLCLPKMSEQRVSRAIEAKFVATNQSAYVSDMLGLCSGPEIEAFGLEAIAANQKVLAVNLDDLYESCPLSMYDKIVAKFKKSATLTAALGKDITRKLIRQYKEDAMRCLSSWLSA